MTFCCSPSHLWSELKDKGINTKITSSQKKKRFGMALCKMHCRCKLPLQQVSKAWGEDAPGSVGQGC